MKKSFNEFELEVQLLCKQKDFKKNRDKLREFRISSFETFVCLLQMGGEIVQSIRAAEEIFKISVKTSLTELEIIELSNRFRFINGLLDEHVF